MTARKPAIKKPKTPSKRTRKPRIDSYAEQAKIIAAANREINPPAHISLNAQDMIFFDSIIKECPKVEWTDHKLELAALLARTMADLETEQLEMRNEGSVRKTSFGTLVANPRKTLIEMHNAKIIAMRRSLGLHARADGKDPRNTAGWRDKAKRMENAAGRMEDEGLIAMPTMVQ